MFNVRYKARVWFLSLISRYMTNAVILYVKYQSAGILQASTVKWHGLSNNLVSVSELNVNQLKDSISRFAYTYQDLRIRIKIRLRVRQVEVILLKFLIHGWTIEYDVKVRIRTVTFELAFIRQDSYICKLKDFYIEIVIGLYEILNGLFVRNNNNRTKQSEM